MTRVDMKKATKEMSADSAAGMDGIPAKLLKECAEKLCPTPPDWDPHLGNKVSNMGPIFFPVYGQSQRRTVSRDMPFFSVIGRTHERKQTHD